MEQPGAILTINGGSSSIKFALYADAAEPRRLIGGAVERIGLPGTSLNIRDAGAAGGAGEKLPIDAPDHASAGGRILDRLDELRQRGSRDDLPEIRAIGHRIVHGGPNLSRPQLVTDALLAELRRIAPLDPDHLPAEIALVELMQRRFAGIQQVACFDTAFHRTMSRVAQILPIPRRYESAGVQRYGFHGLSYQYLMGELQRLAGPAAANGRVILAHLGNGASLAAVLHGRSIDTSMAFTPAAGIPMGTRSGDLDPGLIAFLARLEGMSPEQFDDMASHRSGLIGISETSSDMRDLLSRASGDARSAEAVAVFCYGVKKQIGAYAAALGGVDTLVFSGGIGEHAVEVRATICQGLEFLGIEIDRAANARSEPVISQPEARVTVRVIPTDEELVIARSVQCVVRTDAANAS